MGIIRDSISMLNLLDIECGNLQDYLKNTCDFFNPYLEGTFDAVDFDVLHLISEDVYVRFYSHKGWNLEFKISFPTDYILWLSDNIGNFPPDEIPFDEHEFTRDRYLELNNSVLKRCFDIKQVKE